MNTKILLSSSTIKGCEYDDVTDNLTIDFRSGNSYVYYNVSPEVFDEFIHADSVGSYFNKYIKNSYSSNKV